MPFDSSKEIGTLNLPNDDDTSRYLQTINYTDKCFGEFYDKLDKNGLLKDTVIVIYGDHEGIHKYFPTSLPENNKLIPFIIHIQGMNGLVIDKIGGQIDMMPTIEYLLGLDQEKYYSGLMGRNLLGSSSSGVILSDGSILGQTEDEDHLKEAQDIADIIIKGNYFNIEPKK